MSEGGALVGGASEGKALDGSADAMLARLAADSADPLGGLAGRLDTAGAKAVAISAGVLVVLAVCVGAMFVLGALI